MTHDTAGLRVIGHGDHPGRGRMTGGERRPQHDAASVAQDHDATTARSKRPARA